MNNYSDLSWLPLSDRKNVDMPSVRYEEETGQGYGGYYVPGTKEIVVVLQDESLVPATIAHEFRHYIQYTRGCVLAGSNLQLFEDYEYNEAIRLYFRTQPTEMDALLYEYKVARSYLNKFWLKGLVLPD